MDNSNIIPSSTADKEWISDPLKHICVKDKVTNTTSMIALNLAHSNNKLSNFIGKTFFSNECTCIKKYKNLHSLFLYCNHPPDDTNCVCFTSQSFTYIVIPHHNEFKTTNLKFDKIVKSDFTYSITITIDLQNGQYVYTYDDYNSINSFYNPY
jgi:hypothetical protein